MSIEKEFTSRLKEAMRQKNTKELDVLRMVKTQVQTKISAPGFSGEVDDALWTGVIVGYVKQQKKALQEFKKAGEQGKENADKVEFEIGYLEPFMPQLKGEEEVREIVKQAIEETGTVGAKMAGKVIGFVMKNHKGEVDAAMVKQIAIDELSK